MLAVRYRKTEEKPRAIPRQKSVGEMRREDREDVDEREGYKEKAEELSSVERE